MSAFETIDEARAWRDAAIADGWSIGPTYPGGEPQDWAARLQREGFVALVYTRPKGWLMPCYENASDEIKERYRGRRDDFSVSVWGPDGMAIPISKDYDWATLQAGREICSECKAVGPTVRIGFAGRVCRPCRVKLAPKVEFPGWCD